MTTHLAMGPCIFHQFLYKHCHILRQPPSCVLLERSIVLVFAGTVTGFRKLLSLIAWCLIIMEVPISLHPCPFPTLLQRE